MKNLINNLGLSIKEFAEIYEIPYNTVRQWYNGQRQAPQYIKKMIEVIIELKSKGKQLELPIPKKKYSIIEKIMSTGSFLDIYELDSISFEADRRFWEAEEKKGGKYAPKIRTFQVIEI